jgi:hypothetical protein
MQIYLLVYFLSFFASLIFILVTGDWGSYYRLEKRGVATMGKILADRKQALFRIEGRDYYAALPLIYSFSDESVTVVYDPQNPQVACVCVPIESLGNESAWILFKSLLFALFILWGYHHFRKDYWD